MKRDDTVYLRHMLDAAARIQEYVDGLDFESFKSNLMAQDAVIRQLEIIGEATRNISTALRDKYMEIPWKDIAGMRACSFTSTSVWIYRLCGILSNRTSPS